MRMDDYDGQIIFGNLVGLKLPDIHLTGEEKPRKNLTAETCPDRGSNPGPLRDKEMVIILIASTCTFQLSVFCEDVLYLVCRLVHNYFRVHFLWDSFFNNSIHMAYPSFSVIKYFILCIKCF